jgi:predicted aspartyl protease
MVRTFMSPHHQESQIILTLLSAFQTAIALAKKEASDRKMTKIVLEAKHIEAVVKMSRLFKAYIDEVNDNLDEGGRAKRNQARADNFSLEN